MKTTLGFIVLVLVSSSLTYAQNGVGGRLFVPTQECVQCTSNETQCTVQSHKSSGHVVCGCTPQCDCKKACGDGQQAEIADILSGNIEIPVSGISLTSKPEPSFLQSLDKAKYNGVVLDNVYFGDYYGIVIVGEFAKVYPLEDHSKFSQWDCAGKFTGRYFRS